MSFDLQEGKFQCVCVCVEGGGGGGGRGEEKGGGWGEREEKTEGSPIFVMSDNWPSRFGHQRLNPIWKDVGPSSPVLDPIPLALVIPPRIQLHITERQLLLIGIFLHC